MKNIILFSILLATSLCASANETTPLDVTAPGAVEQCLANSDLVGTYTNKITVGRFTFGLGSIVEEIKFIYSDVKFEEFWEQGILNYSVRIKMTGKCNSVIHAGLAFESIQSTDILFN